MASSYYLIVKRYFDEYKNDCLLPDYIQRGWHRIYTPEEQALNARSCIIGPDVQIPNSVVRRRLHMRQTSTEENVENVRKTFELSDALLANLSQKHTVSQTITEKNMRFELDDVDTDGEKQLEQSPIDKTLGKMSEKRRKYEESPNDSETIHILSIEEIIEEIRTNVGKTLKPSDIKLIADLMQIISQEKQNHVMDIYNHLTDIQLIHQFGGIPKLIQALQDIQKAFEQVAMKTNTASIETVIDVLLENDDTYRIAAELLKSFNENMKFDKERQDLKLQSKFGDVSEHDRTVFQILKNDFINHLSLSDTIMLVNDLETIRDVSANKANKNNRDEQLKFIREQMDSIFNRSHLDGIKTLFQVLKSSVSNRLKDTITKIEKSLTNTFTERDSIIIESYIHDYLSALTKKESKAVYERLAQDGTLKRTAITDDLNQIITMSLMKKINTHGLSYVIENLKHIQHNIDSIKRLVEVLTTINLYRETQSSASLDQIQNQIGMAYFIEIRNLTKQDIYELSKAVHLYSITNANLGEDATDEQYRDFLEQLKTPFIRICIQRILNLISHDSTIDLNQVAGTFYNQHVSDLFHEFINGSDNMNRGSILETIKNYIKKDKTLTDKLYRHMLKEKFVHVDTNTKTITNAKKVSKILHEAKQTLTNVDDRRKQEHLVELLERMDITIPERVKRWYKNKSNMQKIQQNSLKRPNKHVDTSYSKVKSVMSASKRIAKHSTDLQKNDTKGRLMTTPATSLDKPSIKEQRQAFEFRPKDSSNIRSTTTKAEPLLNNSVNDDAKSQQKLNHLSSTVLNMSDVVSNTKLNSEQTNIENDLHTMISPENTRIIIEANDSLPLKQSDSHENPSQVNSHNETEEVKFELSTSEDTHNNNPLLMPQEMKINDHDIEHDENNKSLVYIKSNEFQSTVESIQPELISTKATRDNNTFNSEFNRDPAVLLYSPPIFINDPKRNVHTNILSTTAQLLQNSEYEKAKSERILNKTVSTNATLRPIEQVTVGALSSSMDLSVNDKSPTSTNPGTRKLLDPSLEPSILNRSTSKHKSRITTKGTRKSADLYIDALTSALSKLFHRSEYQTLKLEKIRKELVKLGLMPSTNEFSRSTDDTIHAILNHSITYNDFIKWTLLMLRPTDKPILTNFARDLYAIAIDLDLTLVEHIDYSVCALDIRKQLQHILEKLSEKDLQDISTYFNVSQLEKLVNFTRKLNTTSEERMRSDLNRLLLYMIQFCHTFESQYRPMQIRIRQISEQFKSQAVADLANGIDEMERHLAKKFSITLVGLSQRMNNSRFVLVKE